MRVLKGLLNISLIVGFLFVIYSVIYITLFAFSLWYLCKAAGI